MNKFINIIVFCLFSQTLLAQLSIEKCQDLILSKQYSELESKLLNHLKSNPNDNEMLEVLGDVYGYQNQWSKASECYHTLVEINPKNANYLYKYGGVLGVMAKEGSKFKALTLIRKTKDLFKKAAALDPKHRPVQWAQVQLYAELPGLLGGSYETSWSHAEQLETLSEIEGYLAKLYILEHQQKTALAKQYAKKIVLRHNENPCLKISKTPASDCDYFENSLYYEVGHAYILSEKDLNAAEFFIKKYILNFSSSDRTPREQAHLELAKLYLRKSQNQLALIELNKAIELDSDLDEALQIKEQILKKNIQD